MNFLKHEAPIFMAKYQLPSQVIFLKLSKIYTLRMKYLEYSLAWNKTTAWLIRTWVTGSAGNVSTDWNFCISSHCNETHLHRGRKTLFLYVITFNNLVVITRAWYAVLVTKKEREKRRAKTIQRNDCSHSSVFISTLQLSRPVTCGLWWDEDVRKKVWDLMARH